MSSLAICPRALQYAAKQRHAAFLAFRHPPKTLLKENQHGGRRKVALDVARQPSAKTSCSLLAVHNGVIHAAHPTRHDVQFFCKSLARAPPSAHNVFWLPALYVRKSLAHWKSSKASRKALYSSASVRSQNSHCAHPCTHAALLPFPCLLVTAINLHTRKLP